MNKDQLLARNFNTGGTTSSQDLFHYFQKYFTLERQWALTGQHYHLTLARPARRKWTGRKSRSCPCSAFFSALQK